MKYTFSETNSGGSWWLGLKEYEALMAAGWRYEPDAYDKKEGWDIKGFDGPNDLVPYGWRHNLVGEFSSLREAVESWEAATGQDFFAEGCNCCGAPFSISGEMPRDRISGDSVERKVIHPW